MEFCKDSIFEFFLKNIVQKQKSVLKVFQNYEVKEVRSCISAVLLKSIELIIKTRGLKF